MNPLTKELLLSMWAPLMSVIAIWDWRVGALPGYWAFSICLLAVGYPIKSIRAVAAEMAH